MEELKGRASSKKLILCVENFLVSSGFIIKSLTPPQRNEQNSVNFTKFEVEIDEKSFSLWINVRTIGRSFIPQKDYIKRRQVRKQNLEDLPQNKNNNYSLLLGVGVFNGTCIIACWNPFYYVTHEKNCSCYIWDRTINAAIKNGVASSVDSSNHVIACTESHFKQLLDIYIENNRVD